MLIKSKEISNCQLNQKIFIFMQIMSKGFLNPKVIDLSLFETINAIFPCRHVFGRSSESLIFLTLKHLQKLF